MTAIGHQKWKVVTRKVGPVVPVDVAPDVPLNKMRWLSGKPVHNIENIMHRQPRLINVINIITFLLSF